MIRVRHDCRMCGGDLRMQLELTPTPLANSFPIDPDTGSFIPLEVMQCLDCDHVQLHHVPSADELYCAYKYSTPAAVVPHLEAYAKTLKDRYRSAKTVLEIGCNNGLFLDVLEKAGFIATGVDPAADSPKAIRGFFNAEMAGNLGQCDLIVANNVFAHIDNLHGVFEGIDKCLSPDGALVFEVQYLTDMVRTGAFDMIYHEHHDYHTLRPWAPFLKKFGLVIRHVEHLSVHGGSVRVHCERPGIGIALPYEPIDWKAFRTRIDENKALTRAVLKGKKVKMFGAPAKATTLIHHFGIQENISYAVDSTKEKHNRYIPGTQIKILPEDILSQSKSTSEMFLASWNFADFVRKRYPDISFIVPGEKFQQAA